MSICNVVVWSPQTYVVLRPTSHLDAGVSGKVMLSLRQILKLHKHRPSRSPPPRMVSRSADRSRVVRAVSPAQLELPISDGLLG
jgi:hypothetical protein